MPGGNVAPERVEQKSISCGTNCETEIRLSSEEESPSECFTFAFQRVVFTGLMRDFARGIRKANFYENSLSSSSKTKYGRKQENLQDADNDEKTFAYPIFVE